MFQPIDEKILEELSNPALRDYARRYIEVARGFDSQVEVFGLPFADEEGEGFDGPLVASMGERGLRVENDAKSFGVGWISPACLTCRKGTGTVTYLTSTQCPRSCFFCFNPNQENYEYYLTHTHNNIAELETAYRAGIQLIDVALTGGEPLIHADLAVAFFERANELYPGLYTRLYTSGTMADGSWVDEETLGRLRDAGLNEIRFSVKLDDSESRREELFEVMQMAHRYIPALMVEMPVMPDGLEEMKGLLTRLDSIGVDGINILELCFPFHNADEFRRRGYQLKRPLMRVYYNWWYAGGLPIAGSEEACLRLLDWALDQDFKMGVHYCSLENKYTGQIYQANRRGPEMYSWMSFSERDFFLKSAKAFGDDVKPIRSLFCERGLGEWRFDKDDGFLEFPIDYVEALREEFPDVELGLSYAIIEAREEGPVLRELRIDKITPANFNVETDV